MNKFTYYLKLLFTTIAFLSWIPIPHWAITDRALYRMGMFFPLAGGVLGGVAALVLFLADLCFPYSVAVALTLLVYGWITGMFHEDALADVADGMGGFDAKKMLEIMRDSCIGTYGSFALISTYVLRYAALSALTPEVAIRNMIAYAAVSRVTGVFLLTLTRTRDVPPESLSRIMPFSNQWLCLSFALLFTVVIVGVVSPANPILIPILVVSFPLVARMYFLKKIGYITGDCVGAVIYVTETVLHICATASL